MIKAVLFDFDGTLIDTNELIYQSYNYAFKRVFGRPVKNEEFLRLYGRPLRKSLIEDYGDDGHRLIDEYNCFNEENHDLLVKSFDGTTEGLLLLKESGIKLGIVTSKRLRMVSKGLEFLKYTEMFDAVVTLDDTVRHKPYPDPVLKGCEMLGISPEYTVYVGDSVFDLMAGHAAGTKICAVEYSLTSKEELLKCAPEYFCETIFGFAKDVIRENLYE